MLSISQELTRLSELGTKVNRLYKKVLLEVIIEVLSNRQKVGVYVEVGASYNSERTERGIIL